MRGGFNGFKRTILASGALIIAAALGVSPAQARHHHHHHRHRRHLERSSRSFHRPARASRYAPPFASIVVDANTGRTLYEENQNELRHPASLTKVMTLYLLFEQLQKGRMSLDTEITVSPHAASMEPTKLGLRPGSHITIDSAIRAIVTKSANDMAVAIAEAIGGSESHFCELMTAKAHELGMSKTQYVNASGLPDPGQLTTAHDLALLGRAIQEKFPQYFHYFSLPGFRYAGSYMANHDHLLGHVEGVDGIKTGYTRSSGYNLLTDVRRGGRHMVAVVLGGPSWHTRDVMMERLIDAHIAEASPSHRAAPVLEASSPAAEAPHETRAPAPIHAERAAAKSYEKPRPAFVGSAPKAIADETPVTNSIRRDAGGATPDRAQSSATPEPLRWVVGPQPVRLASTHSSASKSAPKLERIHAQVEEAAVEAAPAMAHHSGIQIQIGATDDADQAKDLLVKAKSHGRGTLARAKPFTEKVEKGGAVLWRARFAGLDASQAQAACRQLKRSGFACFTIKD